MWARGVCAVVCVCVCARAVCVLRCVCVCVWAAVCVCVCVSECVCVWAARCACWCVYVSARCVFGFLCMGAWVYGGEKVEVGMGMGLWMCGV